MDNHLILDSQNNQQIEQNQLNEQAQTKGPPKVNQWLIIAMISLAILISCAVYIFWIAPYTQKKAPMTNRNSSSKNDIIKFQALTFLSTDLDDPETKLYFSDTNKLYEVSLDGSPPHEIISFPDNIGSVSILKNGEIVVETASIEMEKVEDDSVNKSSPPSYIYKEVSSERHYYIVKNYTSKAEINQKKYDDLLYLNTSTTNERIFTNELNNGQAEILVDKLDGTASNKIGLLKEKLLNTQVCEIGENCLKKQHPSEFTPSFDGKFLLNKPPGGGGLGVPGIVVTRDGSKVYKIDFYWYVSSAMWVGNNKLLTKAQDGKQKIITFNEDGTFNESVFEQDLGGGFTQSDLSPTNRYLRLNSSAVGISLFDINNNKIITIEKANREKLIQKYSLQKALYINMGIEHSFWLIGWNNKENKLLYGERIFTYLNKDRTKFLEVRDIKVYDFNTNRIRTVIKLRSDPRNSEEYKLHRIPVAAVGGLAIK